MKFLADAGISPRTVEFLRASGHDAIHVRELDMQRASDAQILERCRIAAVLTERTTELESGTLILVEETRYRVRTLPISRT
jgi:hypothetical protein